MEAWLRKSMSLILARVSRRSLGTKGAIGKRAKKHILPTATQAIFL
jgi:hypothetical protein